MLNVLIYKWFMYVIHTCTTWLIYFERINTHSLIRPAEMKPYFFFIWNANNLFKQLWFQLKIE